MESGVYLIKLLWCKFTNTFCKLHHYIKISNICCFAMKRSSLGQRESNFTLKRFYEINPWTEQIKPFWYYTDPRFSLDECLITKIIVWLHWPSWGWSFKPHLHYDKNHAKLVDFKEHKTYFAFLKPAIFVWFLP